MCVHAHPRFNEISETVCSSIEFASKMCDISLMETKYEGEVEEESGWTSYLAETGYSNFSLFSESSTYSNYCSSKIVNGMQKDEDKYRLAAITRCNSDDDEHIKGVGGDAGNINELEEEEEGANSMKGIREDDIPDDEELDQSRSNYKSVRGATSSTRSDDASSFASSINSPIIISKRSFCKRFYPKLHPKALSKESNHTINRYKRKNHIAAAAEANYYLEDTATSSDPSALAMPLHAATQDSDSASSSSSTTFKVNNVHEMQELFYEEGTDAVSTRFKALEALIPRLKEVAGKGKEEEMVKVIGRHVRRLELQVELLSSAWQSSQLKHQ